MKIIYQAFVYDIFRFDDIIDLASRSHHHFCMPQIGNCFPNIGDSLPSFAEKCFKCFLYLGWSLFLCINQEKSQFLICFNNAAELILEVGD